MTASPRSTTPVAIISQPSVQRWLPLLAALIIAAPGPTEARMMRAGEPYHGRIIRAGQYDGVWNVVFATTQGRCGSGLSVPFMVRGGRVSSAGGGRVHGFVSRAGSVAVSVSVGKSRASGGGRLTGNFGAGSWRGLISGDLCSGIWQATRT